MPKHYQVNINTGITDRALRFIAAMILLLLLIITTGFAATRVLAEPPALDVQVSDLFRLQP